MTTWGIYMKVLKLTGAESLASRRTYGFTLQRNQTIAVRDADVSRLLGIVINGVSAFTVVDQTTATYDATGRYSPGEPLNYEAHDGVFIGRDSGRTFRPSSVAAAASAVAAGLMSDAPRPLARFPLRSSLRAAIWQGTEDTVGYARTGRSAVLDHEGFYAIAQANEALFEGARRVENLARVSSEDFSDSADWLKEGSTVRSGPNADGSTTFTRTTGAAIMLTFKDMVYERDMHAFSFDLSCPSGSQVVRVRFERVSDQATVAQFDFTVSSTVARRYVYGIPLDGSAHRVTWGIVSGSNVAFRIHRFLPERKANGKRHPSEYVPKGIPGTLWPFQGAGVDGVRYYEWLNPNYGETSGEIRTYAERVAIPDSSLLGARRPPGCTNRFFQTGDMSDVSKWTRNNIGAPAPALFANPLGMQRLFLLPETAVTGEFSAQQAWLGTAAADNAVISYSAIARRGPGRRWACMTLTLKDNTQARVFFDLYNGRVGTVTGAIDRDEVIIRPLRGQPDYFEIGWTCLAGAGATVVSASIGPALDDGSASYAGVAGNGIYVGHMTLTETDHPAAYPGHSTASTAVRGEGPYEVPIFYNLPANDFTVAYSFTPLYRTGSLLMTAFYYGAYSYLSATFRFGDCIRPGIKGGNANDADAGGWAQDFYDDTVGFDGVNIRQGLQLQAGQTVRRVWGMSSKMQQPNGSGSFMWINGIEAYTTPSSVPTTKSITQRQSYMRLGSSQVTGKHDACYRDLEIFGRVLPRSTMALQSGPVR